MIVAAHQPNFIPWLGYFDKMQKADLFVSVDHVQMERQSYQNRTSIKTGEGARGSRSRSCRTRGRAHRRQAHRQQPRRAASSWNRKMC
jgi:hypothetical protein